MLYYRLAKREIYKKNEGFSGKIEEEEEKRGKYTKHDRSLEREKEIKNNMQDFASPIEQRHQHAPSEVEIPLDFDVDKSPQVTNTIRKFILFNI